jgi:hypothetical protein
MRLSTMNFLLEDPVGGVMAAVNRCATQTQSFSNSDRTALYSEANWRTNED